jgi:hypothetical protein
MPTHPYNQQILHSSLTCLSNRFIELSWLKPLACDRMLTPGSTSQDICTLLTRLLAAVGEPQAYSPGYFSGFLTRLTSSLIATAAEIVFHPTQPNHEARNPPRNAHFSSTPSFSSSPQYPRSSHNLQFLPRPPTPTSSTFFRIHLSLYVSRRRVGW